MRLVPTVACGDGGTRADSGSFSPLAIKTAAYTIKLTDAGKTFTNRGATVSVALTLPTAKSGFKFHLMKVAGYPVVITRAASESIDRVAGNLTIPASAKGLFIIGSDGTDWFTNTEGGGTSASPLSSETADENHITAYTRSTATTGTSRQRYMRHYIAGAGGAGECLRAFTTVSDVAAGTGGVHGAHISLSFGTSGSSPGLAAAARSTLQIPNSAMPGNGNYAAHMAEISSDGASSDPSSVVDLSFFRAEASGNATGIGKVDDKANLFSIQGVTIGAGNLVAVKSSAAVSHTIRCVVGSTVLYLMASSVQ